MRNDNTPATTPVPSGTHQAQTYPDPPVDASTLTDTDCCR